MKNESTTTASVATYSKPMKFKKTSDQPYEIFDVSSDVFRRFETGRNRYERWKKYLDEDDENQASILKYAKKHPKNTIVLRCSDNGAMRAIRRRAINENPTF
jgi:arylsulfatase A-like enzyme